MRSKLKLNINIKFKVLLNYIFNFLNGILCLFHNVTAPFVMIDLKTGKRKIEAF